MFIVNYFKNDCRIIIMGSLTSCVETGRSQMNGCSATPVLNDGYGRFIIENEITSHVDRHLLKLLRSEKMRINILCWSPVEIQLCSW